MAHDMHDKQPQQGHAPEPAHDASYMRNFGGAHEHSDVSVRGIFGFLITLAVVSLVIQFGIGGMFHYLRGSFTAHDPEPNPMLSGQRQPTQKDPTRDFPQPRLQADPVHDVNRLRVTEDKLLNGPPTWVDEQTGVVRIPIEQAMQLTLERGLPAKPGVAPARAGAAKVAPAAKTATPAAANTAKGVTKK
ncbi:MAG: hypothetical protein M3P27_06385 [Acidobacteriota bacterium]|nr:hypothetical protein [Acidobacteriota bacterium]